MTTLIRWGGSDNRRQSSIYLASDSRFTFPDRFESGRKTFACKKAPYILGFAGSAALPKTAVPSLVSYLDTTEIKSEKEVKEHVIEFLKGKISDTILRFNDAGDCRIVVCARIGENMSAKFFSFVAYFSFNKKTIVEEKAEYSSENNFYLGFGSGAGNASDYNKTWEIKTGSGGFSRAVFSGFYDSVCSQIDRMTNPPPQLVGLMATGTPIDFQVAWNNSIYQGGQIKDFPKIDEKCVDRLFQNIDPLTLAVLPNAQRHGFYKPK